MGKVAGSIHVLSDMQITANTTGLDAYSKTILRNKEVLAVILREVVTEYEGYTRKEVMDFIETDSITAESEVSPGRTNTQVQPPILTLPFGRRIPFFLKRMYLSVYIWISSHKKTIVQAIL